MQKVTLMPFVSHILSTVFLVFILIIVGLRIQTDSLELNTIQSPKISSNAVQIGDHWQLNTTINSNGTFSYSYLSDVTIINETTIHDYWNQSHNCVVSNITSFINITYGDSITNTFQKEIIYTNKTTEDKILSKLFYNSTKYNKTNHAIISSYIINSSTHYRYNNSICFDTLPCEESISIKTTYINSGEDILNGISHPISSYPMYTISTWSCLRDETFYLQNIPLETRIWQKATYHWAGDTLINNFTETLWHSLQLNINVKSIEVLNFLQLKVIETHTTEINNIHCNTFDTLIDEYNASNSENSTLSTITTHTDSSSNNNTTTTNEESFIISGFPITYFVSISVTTILSINWYKRKRFS
ncbi:hypothetical protein [Candidatus Lokiarchaeum ossiferum]|uniref:hypothetical protein n=1 Tax=Candidatus Lokiarchaeum ossiferum TaxID=2951803 RepID=UPI00352D24CF